jgi:hypothetical protein
MARAHKQLLHELRHLDLHSLVATACDRHPINSSLNEGDVTRAAHCATTQNAGANVEVDNQAGEDAAGADVLSEVRGVCTQCDAQGGFQALSTSCDEQCMTMHASGFKACRETLHGLSRADCQAGSQVRSTAGVCRGQQAALASLQMDAAQGRCRPRTGPLVGVGGGQGLSPPQQSGGHAFHAAPLLPECRPGQTIAFEGDAAGNAVGRGVAIANCNQHTASDIHRGDLCTEDARGPTIVDFCTLMLLLCRNALREFAASSQNEGLLTSKEREVLDNLLVLLATGSSGKGSTLVEEEVAALEQQLGKLVVIGGEPERTESGDSGTFSCRCHYVASQSSVL